MGTTSCTSSCICCREPTAHPANLCRLFQEAYPPTRCHSPSVSHPPRARPPLRSRQYARLWCRHCQSLAGPKERPRHSRRLHSLHSRHERVDRHDDNRPTSHYPASPTVVAVVVVAIIAAKPACTKEALQQAVTSKFISPHACGGKALLRVGWRLGLLFVSLPSGRMLEITVRLCSMKDNFKAD